MAKGEFAQKAAKSASLKVASTFAAPEETGTRHFKKTEALAKDELLVQWSAEATTAIRAQIHKQLETEVVETLHTKAMKTSDTGVLEVVINKKSNRSLSQLQKEFSNEATVIFAEPNQTISIQAISNDPKINNLWGMQGSYGSKATTAWDQNYIGSSKIVTGIIDSGIDYTHQDLYLNIWLNQGEIRSLSFFSFLQDIDKDGLITFRDLNSSINLTNPSANLKDWNTNGYIDAGDLLNNQSGWEDGKDNDINGYIDDLIGWDFVNKDNDPYDDNSHGTHVAGTIGAIGNNNTGVSGLNWQTQMIALKTLSGAGSGYLSSAVAATDYFTTAKVQATSRNESSRFIGTNNSWGGGGYSQALADSIKRASDQDLLFIAAAGNGGSDGISDNNDIYQNYPSNYTNSNVIAVASLTSTGALSSFSNYGAISVDLGAPGSAILSTLPGNQYGTYSGTSMATPHVTGALALMASANLQATAQQLKDALLQSTVATTSLSGKTLSGGRLDVAAAISKLNGVPPAATPTYTLTPSASSINEGAALTSTVTTTNVATGTKLYYALSGTGITTADFSVGALTGEGTTDATGKFSFSHTLANDLTTEGAETLNIKLYSDTARTLQVGSTATVSVVDTSKATPTYTLTPSATSINEGSTLTTVIATTNVATGTKLYYALSGTGITTADFSVGALTGEGTTDATGKFSFSHTLANDLTTEGAETLNIKLYSDTARTLQVGSTATVSVVDTSKATPTYTLTPSATSINEGSTLTTVIATTNIATGTKLYYALSGTGITTADFSVGALTGEGTTDATGKFSFSHTLANDLTTEGAETLNIKLYSDTARTLQVGSTATVSVVDTSKATPTYTLTPSATSINEGSTLTTVIATTNVATGTKLYYALSGTGITTADFSVGALTGEGTTDATGKFSFSHTLANDLTTEGAETLNIKLYSDTARTLQVGSTATVSVVDTSKATPTYTLTPSATSINEGSTLTTVIATTNIATGTKLYYALSGTGITTADFSVGALTGEGTTDATGKFSFSHTLANDLTTEGAETLNIKLYSDTARTLQVGSTATVSVVDTSKATPTYTLTPSATSINEGSTLTTVIATTNVATGTKLYYALSGTGITTADFSVGALTGEGTTDATGKFSFSHTLANDLTTEGAETLNIKLYSDTARTLQVGSTATVSVVDTSKATPTYTLTPSATSINEGSTLTTVIATTNVATGTKLYYALSGTGITTADFSVGALTGEGTTDATGKFSFSHTLANDLTTEGAETLNIKLYSDTARTLQVGSTATVSIADTSKASAPIDTTIPTITNWTQPSQLTDSKLDLINGESGKLTFTGKVIDLNDAGSLGSGFSILNLTWREATSGATKSIYVSNYNLIDGSFSSTLDMTWAKTGNWSISSASLSDNAGNNLYYYYTNPDAAAKADEFKTKAGIDLSKLSFSLSNSSKEDSTLPKIVTWNSPAQLADNKLDLIAGESAKLTFTGKVIDLNDAGTTGSGFTNLNLTWREATSGATKSIYVSNYNLIDGSFSSTLDMTWAKTGNWSISSASLSDNAGNNLYYFYTNPDAAAKADEFKTKAGIDLSKLSFSLSNSSKEDSTLPKIVTWNSPAQLADNKLDLIAGESAKLTFTGKVIDLNDAGTTGSGFTNLNLTWREATSGTTKSIYVSNYNLIDGSFSSTLDMTWAKTGNWSISSASLSDNAGNNLYYYYTNPDAAANADEFKTKAGIDLSKLSFSLSNSSKEDSTLPKIVTWNSPAQLADNKLDLIAGESAKLTFTGKVIDLNDAGTTGSGFTNLNLTWREATSGATKSIYVSNYNLIDGSFSSTLDMTWAKTGNWSISSASLSDNAGNNLYYYYTNPDAAAKADEFKTKAGIDLSKLSFSLSNSSKEDSTLPKIVTWNSPAQLADNKLDLIAGESAKLTFTGKVIDLNDAGTTGSGFNSLNLTWREATSGATKSIYVSNYNLIDGSFSSTLDMTWAKTGNWSISSANLSDIAGNGINYSSNNWDSTAKADEFKTKAGIDLSKLSFSLSNSSKEDSTLPKIVTWNSPAQLADNKLDLIAGESAKLTFTGKVIDLNDAGTTGSGFNSLNLTWREATSGATKSIYVSNYNLIDGSFSSTLDMTWAKTGNWSISSANLSDIAGNGINYSSNNWDSTAKADEFKTKAGIDLSKLSFSLSNSSKEDSTLPKIVTWNSPAQLADNKLDLIAGESAKLTFTGKVIDLNDAGTTGSGFNSLNLTWREATSGATKSIYVSNYNLIDGSFSSTLDMTWAKTGNWSISSASLSDNAGNNLYYYYTNPDAAAKADEFKTKAGIDLSKLSFSLSNSSKEDSTLPKIVTWNSPAQLADNKLDLIAGESAKLTFTGKVIDLNDAGTTGSGFNSLNLTWREATSGATKSIYVSNYNLIDGSFSSTLDMTWAKTGNWSISSASLSDNAGNNLYYYYTNPDAAAKADEFKTKAGIDLSKLSFSLSNAVSLGKGQIDTLTGGAGKDVFVLGDSRGVFYNDNINSNSGSSDYALITDFSLIDDKLQLLSGSYLTTVSGGNLSLYWDRNNNGSLNLSGNNQDEMIALINGVTTLSSSNINWVKA